MKDRIRTVVRTFQAVGPILGNALKSGGDRLRFEVVFLGDLLPCCGMPEVGVSKQTASGT